MLYKLYNLGYSSGVLIITPFFHPQFVKNWMIASVCTHILSTYPLPSSPYPPCSLPCGFISSRSFLRPSSTPLPSEAIIYLGLIGRDGAHESGVLGFVREGIRDCIIAHLRDTVELRNLLDHFGLL